MLLDELMQNFSSSRDKQCNAIFSTLLITGNKLQTLFNQDDSGVSLKQFMLLTVVRQSNEKLTFTQLGKLLGCSRQNIKKLASSLEKKGFVEIKQSEKDVRASYIYPTEKMDDYFINIFVSHHDKLSWIFEVYNDKEISQLFKLLMKLYDGIDNFEQQETNDIL